MENFIKILEKIGLTNNEAKVYFSLVKTGRTEVSEIAKESKIYRPYVYDNLKRLQEKGLVSETIIKNKKTFSAISPEKLLEKEKEKMAEIEKSILKLNKLFKTSKEKTSAELFSNDDIVRVIQKDIIKTLKENRGENLVIGVDEKRFSEIDSVIMEQYFEQMKQNNLKERVLVRKGDNSLPGHEKTTAYRFLPKEFFDPTTTFIYGDKVVIVILDEPIHAVVINSKKIADAYRKQFELLWRTAKN